jgi:hypothetical protein
LTKIKFINKITRKKTGETEQRSRMPVADITETFTVDAGTEPVNKAYVFYGGTSSCGEKECGSLAPMFSVKELNGAAKLAASGKFALDALQGKPVEEIKRKLAQAFKTHSDVIQENDASVAYYEARTLGDSINFIIETDYPKIRAALLDALDKMPDDPGTAKNRLHFLYGTDTVQFYAPLMARDQELQRKLEEKNCPLVVGTSMKSFQNDPNHVAGIIRAMDAVGDAAPPGVYILSPRNEEATQFDVYDGRQQIEKVSAKRPDAIKSPLPPVGVVRLENQAYTAEFYPEIQEQVKTDFDAIDDELLRLGIDSGRPVVAVGDGNKAAALIAFIEENPGRHVAIEGKMPKMSSAQKTQFRQLLAGRKESGAKVIFINPRDYGADEKYRSRYDGWDKIKQRTDGEFDVVMSDDVMMKTLLLRYKIEQPEMLSGEEAPAAVCKEEIKESSKETSEEENSGMIPGVFNMKLWPSKDVSSCFEKGMQICKGGISIEGYSCRGMPEALFTDFLRGCKDKIAIGFKYTGLEWGKEQLKRGVFWSGCINALRANDKDEKGQQGGTGGVLSACVEPFVEGNGSNPRGTYEATKWLTKERITDISDMSPARYAKEINFPHKHLFSNLISKINCNPVSQFSCCVCR